MPQLLNSTAPHTHTNLFFHSRIKDNSTYLCHLFSICFWVQRSFRQQDWVFFRCYTKFIVEGVMPNLFHVIPVGHNTMLNGVLQGKYTSLRLCFITNIAVFLPHAHHHTLKNKVQIADILHFPSYHAHIWSGFTNPHNLIISTVRDVWNKCWSYKTGKAIILSCLGCEMSRQIAAWHHQSVLALLYCLGSVRHTSYDPLSREGGNSISYTSEHRHQNCK